MNKPFISIGDMLTAQTAPALSKPEPPARTVPAAGPEAPAGKNRPDVGLGAQPGAGGAPIRRETRSGRSRFYVDQGLLLYGRNSEHVLLDGQVILLADMLRSGTTHASLALCYLRSHVLMESRDGGVAVPVLDAGVAGQGEGQRRLTRESYLYTDWADGALGFWGAHNLRRSSPFESLVQPLASLGDWSVFQDQLPQQVAQIVPQFYIQSPAPARPMAGDTRAMVDVRTGRIDNYRPLWDSSPLAAAAPLELAPREAQELKMSLWQQLLFDPVYVGMSAVGPRDWKATATAVLDPEQEYTQLLQHPVELRTLAIAATAFDLRIDAFFSSGDPDLLLEPARDMRDRLLERAALPNAPILSRLSEA